MHITVSDELTCPHCKSPELNPATNLLNIRGFKVESGGHWWSHCLVCSDRKGKPMWFK